MTTSLSPLRERRAALPAPLRAAGAGVLPACTQLSGWEAERALAELFPDLRAAADAALADLFPALRVRRTGAEVRA